MTDDQTPAPVAGAEVVQSEAEQVTAPEVAESTEGQEVETPPAKATEEEAQAEPDAAEDEGKSKSQERRERRRKFQDKLREDAEAAQKAQEEAEARLAAAREAAGKLPTPRPEDFATPEEYQASLSAIAAAKMMDEREVKRLEAEARATFAQQERIQAQRIQEATQNWEAQVGEAQGKYDDFDAVVRNDDLPISQNLAVMLMGSDAAADVAYHLGKNPDQAERLSALCDSPNPALALEAARELGRLEAMVTTPKSKTVTDAPAPIEPVRPAASASLNWEAMSPSEYDEWRAKGGKPTL
jgi:hypothetical protein